MCLDIDRHILFVEKAICEYLLINIRQKWRLSEVIRLGEL